jgi:hypothetical protein
MGVKERPICCFWIGPTVGAGKGTIQQQLIVKIYGKKLDHLYSLQEIRLLIEVLTLANSFSPGSVKGFTKEIYSQALEVDDLRDDEDIFIRGMDYLRVSMVIQRLRAALKSCRVSLNIPEINSQLVY